MTIDDDQSKRQEVGKISSDDYQIKSRHYVSYLVKAK